MEIQDKAKTRHTSVETDPRVKHEKPRPCPVSKRLAKQKFSTWGFPINLNEAEIFFA